MEIGRIGREPLGVGLADRVQGLLALQAGRGRLHHLERPAHAALDRRGEELLLRPEEAEDVGLRDPDRPGDRLGRAAVRARARRTPTSAASRISSRRSSALFRSATGMARIVSDYSLTCQVTSAGGPSRGPGAPARGPARRRSARRPPSSSRRPTGGRRPARSAGQPALNSNHMHSNECSLSCMNVSIVAEPRRAAAAAPPGSARARASSAPSGQAGSASPGSEPGGMPARPSPSKNVPGS